jgi:hypothetical protein
MFIIIFDCEHKHAFGPFEYLLDAQGHLAQKGFTKMDKLNSWSLGDLRAYIMPIEIPETPHERFIINTQRSETNIFVAEH